MNSSDEERKSIKELNKCMYMYRVTRWVVNDFNGKLTMLELLNIY